MLPVEMSENQNEIHDAYHIRSVLEQYERSKILEVYFSRIDGRVPDIVPADQRALYEIDLNSIKGFLLGQHPQDTLLMKVFRMMN